MSLTSQSVNISESDESVLESVTERAMKNRLCYGDCLDVMREHVKDKSVDLIYLDPPFNSKRIYNAFLGGGAEAKVYNLRRLTTRGDGLKLLMIFMKWLRMFNWRTRWRVCERYLGKACLLLIYPTWQTDFMSAIGFLNRPEVFTCTATRP